jgi:RNA-directed DNA polymerase
MDLRNDKRQKTQREGDSMSPCRGEAHEQRQGESESYLAVHGSESPADTDTEGMMEEICEWENLKEAIRQVKANQGSAGIDGMSVDELPGYREWMVIREQLLGGSYKPQPVKRVEIAKPDGGIRKLGIPTVLDRVVQQAVMQVLQKQWDRTFSDSSFGFRPGRSAHQAVEQAQQYIAAGYGWVVDLDLEKFFDRVNHDKLMGEIAKRIRDKRLLKLIRAFLNAGVMENGLVSPSVEGTPQGGPLSPLLSNLVLDELDRELEHRRLRFVRYADDCNIYVRSEKAGQRVMESVKRFITKRLKLKVNEQKSAVARPQVRKFLGFSFSAGPEVRRMVAPKAIARFKDRIRDITGRARSVSLEQTMSVLAPYMRGWRGYFGFCETPDVLIQLTGWVRRRLRAAIWRQWKTRCRRRAMLTQLGVRGALARSTAGSTLGAWHLAHTKALSIALSNDYFRSRGFPSLYGRC